MPWTIEQLTVGEMPYSYPVCWKDRSGSGDSLAAALLMFVVYAWHKRSPLGLVECWVRQAGAPYAAAQKLLTRQQSHVAQMRKLTGDSKLRVSIDEDDDRIAGEPPEIVEALLEDFVPRTRWQAVDWQSGELPTRLTRCHKRSPALVMIRILQTRTLKYAVCVDMTHTNQLLYLDPAVGLVLSATSDYPSGGRMVYAYLKHSFPVRRPGTVCNHTVRVPAIRRTAKFSTIDYHYGLIERAWFPT